MINRNFKYEWKIYDSVELFRTKHMLVDVEKTWFVLAIGFSWKFRMIHMQILNLIITIF